MTVKELIRKVQSGEATASEQREYYKLTSDLANGAEVRSDMPDLRGARSDAGRTEADKAFTHYLRTGSVSQGMMEVRTDPPGFSEGTQPGQISGSGGTYGGYAVAQGFWANLQVALKAYGGIANDYKLVETDTGAITPWPTINPTGVAASVMTTENTQLSLDNPYVFGQGVLSAWPITTSPVLVSIPMVQDFAFDIDAFIADRFGEAIGREIASLAISGTGSSQPLGVNTSLAAGASVGTVGTGSISPVGNGWVQLATAGAVKNFSGSTTELSANTLAPATLLAMTMAIDPAYWPTCKFYMNATQLAGLRGQVDSNGRPLLNMQDGISDGLPGTIFGYPVVVDNSVGNLTASTVGGPVFGAMDRAMVKRQVRATAGGVTVMRLDQRWADYLAVGYLGFIRVDMRSNDLRAAVTCKPAAT
jgi:HK97 family phage major capsid protein